jgi:cell wall-associated NlpC family hydrolase
MEALPQWAADYVGLPYKTGGRARDGLDCYGLIRLVWLEQFGHEALDNRHVEWSSTEVTAAVGAYMAREAEAEYQEIPAGKERAGDAILIRMRGHPLHVGIVIASGYMLHVAESCDAVIEQYRRLAWERRILGFYRPNTLCSK